MERFIPGKATEIKRIGESQPIKAPDIRNGSDRRIVTAVTAAVVVLSLLSMAMPANR